ncbi:MAG: mechanosensitive ion channel family protein [Thermoflexales bacterium]|nr:mechanosensitive ion channel family protein [Thermoflexales bacterium]
MIDAIRQVALTDWLALLALWLALSAGLLLSRQALLYLTMRGQTLARLTQTLEVARALIQITQPLVLAVVALYVALALLGLPAAWTGAAGRVALVALLVQAALWGNALISEAVERYRHRRLAEDPSGVTALQVFGFIGRLALGTVTLLLILDNLGVNITALLASVGIASIAIGLAVQNILGDLFASLSIVMDRPFMVGDFIIVDNFMGTVERIGLRTTQVRSLSGELLVFSNTDLTRSRLRNFKRMTERRVVLLVNVPYETAREKLDRVPAILREAIEAQPKTRFERAHFKEFGAYALVFEAVYWVLDPDFNLYMDVQQAVNFAVLERFRAEAIALAYPAQVLFVHADGQASSTPSPLSQTCSAL